ncbi:hypothetical protein BJX63DRAFT_416654 [Aspergillus granulosus]|uniref:Uncharacterized protein n=1 Tax=Aspergillus granulosus TaxID=176169 RepID=A0ABR4GRQ9_9EURO
MTSIFNHVLAPLRTRRLNPLRPQDGINDSRQYSNCRTIYRRPFSISIPLVPRDRLSYCRCRVPRSSNPPVALNTKTKMPTEKSENQDSTLAGHC